MNSLDSAMAELLHLHSDSRLTSKMKDQICGLLPGLRFLELYEQCLIKWNEALQGKKNRHLGSVRSPHIKATLEGAARGLYTTGIHALETQNFRDWDASVSNLLERIQRCKPNIKEVCLELLVRSFQIRFSSFELQKFFSSLSDSLDEIIRKEMVADSDIKMQIRGIKEKLQLFAQIFEFSRKIRRSKKDLKDLIILSQSWAYNAACLSLLYWVLEQHKEPDTPIRMRIFLSTPEVTEMFLAVLKFLWSISHDRLLMEEGVSRFVDFLLEILQLVVPLKDDVENLHKELICLTTFLINPPLAEDYRKDAESIASQIHDLFCSLSANKFEAETLEKKNIFLEKIKIIKEEVRILYAQIFKDSSSFDFPRTNVLGFLESLLMKVNEVSSHFSNQQVMMLREDLQYLSVSLRVMLEFQNQRAELKDLVMQIVNVLYRIEIAINSFLCLSDSVWCDMSWLSKLNDEIKLISRKLKEILDQPRFHGQEIRSSSPILPPSIYTPIADVVGFEDEAATVINQLVRGAQRLTICSIVGMAGQGKTTLAKKVYDDLAVMRHFHVRGWVTVSHTYERRALLLGILMCISPNGSDIYQMHEEDLAYLIRRNLLRRKFIIVLDDIWDIRAFDDLTISFPDDGNGSRIVLTGRRDLAPDFGYNFTHRVRSLSHGESWVLLQKELFPTVDCPPEFKEAGKRVARNCNGLPLAVVLAARLLSKDIDNLDWWEEVAETLDSRIANEGGKEIVELSYINVPEHLKPCFLYFGALQQDKVIRVRRLIELWISEGFIHNPTFSTDEHVAEGYLWDLISRNLIVPAKRSSTGGIKECRINSIFHEFCVNKAKEEKFLQVESGKDLFFDSKCAIYKNYRVCIESGGDGFFASNPWGPCVHSMLFVADYTCLNKGDLFSICNFILLQVLDLEDVELNGFFPEEVILLVLLRYLVIWCLPGILCIPESIANLRNLETFRVKRDVRSGDEIVFPHTIWRMKRLRHLDVGGFTASFSCDEDDERSLTLHNVQTFSSPSLCCGEDADKLLRRLPNVRKLRCRFNDPADPYQQKNRFPTLDFLHRLESLNLRYTGSLFSWCALHFPSTLRKLALAQFKLPWKQISMIAELPNLEVLKLLKDAFHGETWCTEDREFGRLKFLKLCELDIAKWNTSSDAFPCLEQLIVESCDELEMIPSEFGEIFTLQKIQVRWCKAMVADSVRKIQEEQFAFGNEEFEVHMADMFLGSC